MTDAPRLARLARQIGATRVGTAALARGYQVAAAAAARLLHRHHGVDGVYLTGSLLHPARLHPGYSDIDLVIVADLPRLEDELRLRRALARDLGRLNAAGPLFKHFDYVDLRDLELLRWLGDRWSLAIDSTWQPLAGTSRLGLPVHVSPEKVRLERLIASLRRWQGSSSFLVDGGSGRSLALNLIGARRTLADALSAWFGLHRGTNLTSLLAQARVRGDALPVLRELARHPADSVERSDEAAVVDYVIASLEVLEVFAAEITSGWCGTWAPEFPMTGAKLDVSTLSELTKDAGLSALYLAPDRYGDDVPFVLSPPGASARSAVASLRRLLGARTLRSDAATIPRPVLLTPPLWQAAALLDSPPFTGADLALHARRRWGERWPTPPRPEGQTWDDLLVGRAVQMLWRPRGRSLRAEVRNERALAKMRYEVLVKGPALSRLLGVSAPDSGDPAGGPMDERALISRLRDWIADVRPVLAARVKDAQSGR